MTKKFEFDWRIPVPEPLLTGCVFDRWTEVKDDKEIEYNCTFKVDEYGFFIYWKSEGKVNIDKWIKKRSKIEHHQKDIVL
jgi:phosphatidylinositol phospholipase C, beta